MKAFTQFQNRDSSFWAYVKFVSEQVGYSNRKTKSLKRFSKEDIIGCLVNATISTKEIITDNNSLTDLRNNILKYLNLRAELLEKEVCPNLMTRNEAKRYYQITKKGYNFKCNFPFNKQKGNKKHQAYLTCLLNMLTEKSLGGKFFDDNPRGLTIITKNTQIIGTLSRWMDGAYPTKLNPLAIWEIKEYYGTTTFGSRVADGVYETMLDGMELKEIEKQYKIKVYHFLIIDDKYTWWTCGKSYLCRIIDLLNMGLVDEVIVGKEILTRWPSIIKELKDYQVRRSLS